jgi:hypothetical protein
MAEIPDCTLTTACFLLNKYSKHSRSLDDTIKGMETLLSVPCYLVIYCNEELKEHIIEKRRSYNLENLTCVIVKEIEELWTYQFADKIRENRETYWPTRDERISGESMMVVFNKFNFVLNTMLTNPFNTKKFGWIDGSLGENGKKICEGGNFHNLLLYNMKHATEKFHLQILNVEDKKFKLPENKREYYQRPRWVAVGCLFITGVEIGVKILTRLHNIVSDTIKAGYGHHEEYCYLEVLDEFYDDIVRGYGDYAQTLHNFLKPTRNMWYIYWQIVMRYFNMGYYRECINVCRTIISSYDDYQPIEMDYNVYFRVYSILYHSLIKLEPTEAKNTAKTIRKYYVSNPIFKHCYDALKTECGMNDFKILE